ncbi:MULTISPECIES: RNA polymerase sigma factor [unclassified Nocardia]|uniref:RNA polymerase sigma factor n=1 Tax=unclassified Nocardia TaxID=2637762 RepID=UPI001CE4683C|nr:MULTISPECIES: sigma-70 family RNA polymerase sigma factor [unclassified Nocardia]
MTDPKARTDYAQKFEAMFRRHSTSVFRYAYKRLDGDAYQASDIVQEVFKAVWSQFDRDFSNLTVEDAAPMIMKIATRRVVDSIGRKKEKANPVAEFIESQQSITSHGEMHRDPLDLIIDRHDLEYFRHAIEKCLTENEYEVALMSWDLEIPDAEIAEIIGCTISTVRSHRSRARKKIREIQNRDARRIETGITGTGSRGGVTA